jgi:short-subunit dehydrogenase
LDTLKGKTALVTGASSGIGAAIAQQLAAAGVHLVLVARSEDALNKLATRLATQHGVRCTVITADLGQPGCGAMLQSRVAAIGIAIDILINNAGFGTYGAFEIITPDVEQDEIAVNVAAVVGLAHAFLPGMIQRGHGAMLNVASTASFQPGPYMAVYAATKAFVLSFSEALWAEYRGRGIHVAALCPGAVATGFIDRLGDPDVQKTAVFAVTLRPEQVALHAMAALRSRKPTHIVGIKNWLMAQSPRFSPRRLVAMIGASMMRPAKLANVKC